MAGMADADRSSGERPPTAVLRSDGAAAPAGLKLVLGAMVLAILLTAAYWVIWFLVDRDLLASSHAPAYYTFENAIQRSLLRGEVRGGKAGVADTLQSIDADV
jgi:hypothetical protein